MNWKAFKKSVPKGTVYGLSTIGLIDMGIQAISDFNIYVALIIWVLGVICIIKSFLSE